MGGGGGGRALGEVWFRTPQPHRRPPRPLPLPDSESMHFESNLITEI